MNLRGCLLATGLVLFSGAPALARTLCPVPAPDCVISLSQANGQDAGGVPTALPAHGPAADGGAAGL